MGLGKLLDILHKGSIMTDKILCSTPFLQLIERDGWYYYANVPGSMGGVVILLYRTDQAECVLGRYEICPAHGDVEPMLTTIAGGIEAGDTPLDTCIKESMEEAGYNIYGQNIIDLGKCMLSTNQDTVIYLFACDVTGLPRTVAVGDGTIGEIGSYCEWVTPEQAILSKSAFMSALMLRLYVKTGIRLF